MSELLISRFANTPLSLGLICDFVSRFPPFDRFEFRHMAVTLRHQLEAQSHLVAGLDDQIVGYLGWIQTTRAIAETWVEGDRELTAVTDNVDALAATVLATDNPKFVLPLIRRAKALNPGLSVYWKRQFSDGRVAMKRSVRKKI